MHHFYISILPVPSVFKSFSYWSRFKSVFCSSLMDFFAVENHILILQKSFDSIRLILFYVFLCVHVN